MRCSLWLLLAECPFNGSLETQTKQSASYLLDELLVVFIIDTWWVWDLVTGRCGPTGQEQDMCVEVVVGVFAAHIMLWHHLGMKGRVLRSEHPVSQPNSDGCSWKATVCVTEMLFSLSRSFLVFIVLNLFCIRFFLSSWKVDENWG